MRSVRPVALRACMALASLCVLAGPGFGQTARTSAPADASTHVYVLRGFLNIFSPGLDTLATEIENRNITATINNHLAWAGLAENAIVNYQSGRERTIIVIGHSLGGSAAGYFAERLEKAGVPVSLMVTIDPVPGPTVPGNVKRAVNYYISNGMGGAAARAADDHGTVTNVDRRDLNHVSITTAPDIHREVLGYVMQAVAEAQRPAAPKAATAHRGTRAKGHASAATSH